MSAVWVLMGHDIESSDLEGVYQAAASAWAAAWRRENEVRARRDADAITYGWSRYDTVGQMTQDQFMAALVKPRRGQPYVQLYAHDGWSVIECEVGP